MDGFFLWVELASEGFALNMATLSGNKFLVPSFSYILYFLYIYFFYLGTFLFSSNQLYCKNSFLQFDSLKNPTQIIVFFTLTFDKANCFL